MWKIESAYLDGIKFKIRIAKHEPAYHFIVAHFDEDLRGLSDDELINRTLDSFFAANYVEKFAKETSERVDQINGKLAEMDTAIAESRQATVENQQRVDMAVAELTGLIMGFMETLGGAVPEGEEPHEA